jgi:hypothetical protein
MTPLARLGRKLPWPDRAGDIIKEFARMPSPLCTAVGGAIREMSVEDVSCHCGCQDRTHRFDIHYRFDQTALGRDVACRLGLLHARSLDPGLDPQEYGYMMRHLEVDFRAVMYMANLKDEDDFTSALDYAHFTPHVTARTWEEVGQVVHMATVRHFAT